MRNLEMCLAAVRARRKAEEWLEVVAAAATQEEEEHAWNQALIFQRIAEAFLRA
jgi:hypothetical protein